MSVLRQCGALAARQMLTAPQRKVALTAILLGGRSQLQPKVICINSRDYKKFGHEREQIPRMTYIFHFCVGTLFFISVLDWGKVKKMLTPKVDADAGNVEPEILLTKSKRRGKAGASAGDEDDDDDQVDETGKAEKKKEKDKMGFRERKILEYENRIRQFSTPDKVFRYFATVRVTTSAGPAVYMTPDDFLRSIVPGVRQPDGLGLDQYRRYDPKSVTDNLDLNLEKSSIFYKLGSYGLITFSDYIFLLTVLSTSRRHFEIAFQMFDLNGDGDVDSEEFEKVATLVRQQSSMGSRHRDHSNTGNMFKGVNSALTVYFFGKDLKQKLTIEKFLDFQTQLQCEILSLEFERKRPNEAGLISELDFAELLLAYAGYPHKIKARKLKRVKRRFKDEASKGISKQDYLDFFHFLNNINDVDTALTFYHIAGASIDQATLRHVARTVAKRDLSQHVVDVVFTIFDEDNDNQLSNTEFVAVMKNRIHRGLEKPKDTGFVRLMRSMLKCAKETKPVLLDL